MEDDINDAALDGRSGCGGAARNGASTDERAGIPGAGLREGREGGPAEAAFEGVFNLCTGKKADGKKLTRPWRTNYIEGRTPTSSSGRWRSTW